MSLVGNLEDLGLGEILQIVSLSRKSGLLAIKSSDQEAKIFFRQGQVVKASSTAFPVDLCQSLLAKGVIDQTALEFAKSLQEDGGYTRRLGDIIVKECKVDAATVEELGRGLVENIAYSLFDWEEGTFDFELQDNLDVVDDIRTDTLQLMLGNGLNAQYLAMEGSRIIDEQRYNSACRSAGSGDAAAEDTVDIAFDLLQEPQTETGKIELSAAQTSELPTPRKIVLVDDDESLRDLLASALNEQGYAVSCYGKGEEALIGIDNLCRAGERPLLVVDLIMPRMDGSGLLGGLELMELVRANFPDLVAMVLTDHHNADAEQRLAELGCSLMLKPARGDIIQPSVANSFAERLSRELEGGGSVSKGMAGYTVNIGDELRMEMGEESSQSGGVLQSTGISLLRGMLEELNNPALGGGIILLVLRFASEFMARALIFIVKEEEIVGLGQFGIEDRGQPADVRVRAIKIPCREKSVFSQVVESQLPVKLQMDCSYWSRYLMEQIGGDPVEAFLGPIVSEGKVVALLYGDNGNEGRPIGDTDSLEIFLSQAGIAMEKALLQRRLKEKHPEVM